MSLNTIAITPPLTSQAFLHWIRALVRRQATPTADSADECRDRRAFIVEMMDAHPDAFRSELDCQMMMHFYPGRF